jgi:hypothetical protein
MPEVVSQVRDLLDAYDDAQTQINTLNQSSDGRVLIRADVLQWSAGEASSSSYGPAQEIGRVRGLLAQYFGSSPLFGMNGYADATYIVRA